MAPAGDRDTERPIVNITGTTVALGPLHAGMVDLLYRWFNNLTTDRTQGDMPGPRSRDRAAAWYERRVATTDGSDAWFVIYEVTTWDAIGLTWLSDIDQRNRTAGFGISIGEERARGKGYGTEVTRLMLDYAFTALGLHNVSLEVYAHNTAGLRAYERAGFREYGRRHECYRFGQELHDEIHMECLATWFDSPVLGTVFVPDAPRENPEPHREWCRQSADTL